MHDQPVTVTGRHKSLPLMAHLFDGEGTEVTGDDIESPPVAESSFDSTIATTATDVSDDALPSSWSTDGNQFEWVDSMGLWQYNVRNWDFSAPGTYTFEMKSGDETEYTIAPTCTVEFVIE